MSIPDDELLTYRDVLAKLSEQETKYAAVAVLALRSKLLMQQRSEESSAAGRSVSHYIAAMNEAEQTIRGGYDRK